MLEWRVPRLRGVVPHYTQNPYSCLWLTKSNPRTLGEWLVGMSLPERARNLRRISYDLTVCARRVRGCHPTIQTPRHGHKDAKFSSQRFVSISFPNTLGHYTDGEEIKVYPIDVFAQILFEKATQLNILIFSKGSNKSDEDEDVNVIGVTSPLHRHPRLKGG